MIAPTPPMGWNSWNTFGPDIDEEIVRTTADAMVSTGLKDAGYDYVCIDDLWEADERVVGKLSWDRKKFPEGIKPVADHVHSKGLKFGIYSCAGSHTCAGKPASYGYEEVDAQTCKLIVIDQTIRSVGEFKQIVGRGTRINEDYAGAGELILVGVLKGSFVVLADLARRITIPHRIEFIAISRSLFASAGPRVAAFEVASTPVDTTSSSTSGKK